MYFKLNCSVIVNLYMHDATAISQYAQDILGSISLLLCELPSCPALLNSAMAGHKLGNYKEIQLNKPPDKWTTSEMVHIW